MKNFFSTLLFSVILVGCSKNPLKKSVKETHTIDEKKQILEFEDKSLHRGFEFFYEDVQEFHTLIKDDNLTKLKFQEVLYQHYFDDKDYLFSFDFESLGYLYSDSIENKVA